jgi:hypothetical protein
VREWSEYEWKIRNQLLVGTTGGISSQAFGRRRLGFSLASPVLENMDVALGFGIVKAWWRRRDTRTEPIDTQTELSCCTKRRMEYWRSTGRRAIRRYLVFDMSITWKLDKISYDSNFCKKFIGMPSEERFIQCLARLGTVHREPKYGNLEAQNAGIVHFLRCQSRTALR